MCSHSDSHDPNIALGRNQKVREVTYWCISDLALTGRSEEVAGIRKPSMTMWLLTGVYCVVSTMPHTLGP